MKNKQADWVTELIDFSSHYRLNARSGRGL